MRALPLLTAGLTVAAVVGLSVAGAEDETPRQPVSVVVEDEGPGTERVPVVGDEGPGTERVPVVEDEGPGTDTVPAEPRYACVDGVCDTWGESDEGPGTTG